ncbi:unnamed protein product [Allacma fusca]|uniref:Uncharacterized protein n=1 Tax=Allacma fusca TaxID=39272 RepID=A0A8J2PKY4_9HEXA|nr:unnamed protein product [Allacma fusca]
MWENINPQWIKVICKSIIEAAAAASVMDDVEKHAHRFGAIEPRSKEILPFTVVDILAACFGQTVEWKIALPVDHQLPKTKVQMRCVCSEINIAPDQPHSSLYLKQLVVNCENEEIANEVNPHEKFVCGLKQWAIIENISHSPLRKLLRIINTNLQLSLPNDPRTFLGTPRSTIKRKVVPGHYVHIGLKACLENELDCSCYSVTHISVNINIDGLPLTKRSNSQVWRIQGQISDAFNRKPFVIGI